MFAATTLSSARPWIRSSGRVRLRGLRQEGTPFVRRVVDGRQAEIALGVVGVVEAPVGHRRAGDRGVEDVGAAQHGERGEVATEAPTADAHLVEVEKGVALGELAECAHLIVEHRAGQIEVNRALPRRAPPGRAAAVDDHDREALVGEPLRAEVGGACVEHPLGVGTAVRIEQDRQRRRTVVVARQHECARRLPVAGAGKRDVRFLGRDHGVRRHQRSVANSGEAPVGVEGGRPGDDGRSTDGGGVHTAIVGEPDGTIGLRPCPHVLFARLGVGGRGEHHASVTGVEDRAHVDVGWAHGIVAHQQAARTVTGSAHHQTIAVEPARGTVDQVDPRLIVIGEECGRRSGRGVDAAHLEVVLIARNERHEQRAVVDPRDRGEVRNGVVVPLDVDAVTVEADQMKRDQGVVRTGGRIGHRPRDTVGMGRIGEPPASDRRSIDARHRERFAVRSPPVPAGATHLLAGDEFGRAPRDLLVAVDQRSGRAVEFGES